MLVKSTSSPHSKGDYKGNAVLNNFAPYNLCFPQCFLRITLYYHDMNA